MPEAPAAPVPSTPAVPAPPPAAAPPPIAAPKPASGAPAAPAVVPKPGAPAPAPAAPAPAKPPEDPQSKQLAALAKRERDIRAQEAAFKEREAKWQAYEKAREQAKLNPLAFLEAGGVSFEKLQDFIINQKQPTAEMKREEELTGIKAEVERLRKYREEEAARAQQANIEVARGQWKAAALKHAEAAGETYELSLAHPKAMDLAAEAAEQHFAQTGQVPSFDAVLAQVEAYYESELLTERMLTSKKLRAKLQPVVTKPGVQAASQQGPSREVPRTLTNAAGPNPTGEGRPLSEQERRDAAVEALRRHKRGQ